jgi:hypothetical protein
LQWNKRHESALVTRQLIWEKARNSIVSARGGKFWILLKSFF